MAREDGRRPTEMPEKSFRRSDEFRDVREIARRGALERTAAEAEGAARELAAVAANVTSPVGALTTAASRPGATRTVLILAAIGGWALVIASVLKWGGLV